MNGNTPGVDQILLEGSRQRKKQVFWTVIIMVILGRHSCGSREFGLLYQFRVLKK